MIKVAVDRNTLLKTASTLRTLNSELTKVSHEIEAFKQASLLLSEGVIDSLSFNEKVAELQKEQSASPLSSGPSDMGKLGGFSSDRTKIATNIIEEYLLTGEI